MEYRLESGNSQSMEQVPEISENMSVSDSDLEVNETSENYDDCGADEVAEEGEAAEEASETAEGNDENFDDCIISESTEERDMGNESPEEQDEFDDCTFEKEYDYADFEKESSGEVNEEGVETEPKIEEKEKEPEVGEEQEPKPEVKEKQETEAEVEEEQGAEPEVEEKETETEQGAEPEVEEKQEAEPEVEEKQETEPEVEEKQETEPEVEEKQEIEPEVEEEQETELKIEEEKFETGREENQDNLIEKADSEENTIEKVESDVEDVSGEEQREHTFEDWISTDNYDENGHYIGEEQEWGYKPYGKDTNEFESLLQSPEQQRMAEYMAQHNYGREDYTEYSQDPEWQQLNVEYIESLHTDHDVAESKSEYVEVNAGIALEETGRSSELKEISNKRDMYAEELAKYKREQEILARETSDKFDVVMHEERGTDTYKKALQEYNEAKDRQTEITSRVADMEKEQEDLNKKTRELRTAQLEKGEMAVADSVNTLAVSSKLQDRFEECYYTKKHNINELKNLQNENSYIIEELSSERDSVQLAMEAKMSEIRDYVFANNLERFDTERDPYYQKMIAEYRTLEETYHSLRYHVVKLDDNNLQIAEITGSNYESIYYQQGTQIKEVADGTDVPGKTNYFIDEIREKEVLIPFKQGNWEHLSIKEQKRAIDSLANYNAEILGIDNPPAIVYYKKDDPTDFGGFSAASHIIYINENNISDAAETVDTISHEYRHCYQHERANKLENERDLEYKEGFDNYIAPENSYIKYKNQLVEKDAREYADVIKSKLFAIETEESDKLCNAGASEGEEKSFKTLNPEKGTVFDGKHTDRLPENFEKKNVEIRDIHEIFEMKEFQEIKDHVLPTYENGAKIAGRIKEFNTYKEHHKIDSGHIGKVHDKSLQAAAVLEVSFKENSYGGLYSDLIDRKSLEMMALYHDTGMDGNVEFEKFDQLKQQYLSEPENRENYVKNQLFKNTEMTPEEANRKFESEAYENQFRREHSVQSAIHALRDRKFIESYGVDADKVALGCLVHSKTNSGVNNLADEEQWNEAIGRLQNTVNEFNKSHPNEQIVFSDSFLKRADGTFDDEALAEMRSESLCLRIGDANGHDSSSRISQNGKEIQFSLDDWKEVKNNLSEGVESKIVAGDCNKFKAEVQNAHVVIDGVTLNDENDSAGFSRMFAVGEGNFKAVDLELVNGQPTQKFELENGDAYPMSTQYCILERLKEYNTAKIDSQMEIQRPAGISDDGFKSYKMVQMDAMQKMDFVAEINLGSVDDMTRISYEAFADKVKDQYNIVVVIKSEAA